MAEIADWSPVDESNNTAPPVGAPENMAPSAVNNTMRAMMGSIRRWYDSVTGVFLPLAGGTVTGDLVVEGNLATASALGVNGIELSNLLGALYVNNEFGGGIGVGGPTAGYAFEDRDGVSAPWLWYADGGAAHFLRSDGGDIITVSWAGQVWVTGNLAVSGNQTINGSLGVATLNATNVTATGSIVGNTVNANAISSNGPLSGQNIIASGSGSVATDLSVGDELSVGGLSTLTNVHVVGGINAIGNDANFYIRKTGGEYVINFEANTYLMFNSATNNFSIVIDGVTKASW